jgi:hypothetical protein
MLAQVVRKLAQLSEEIRSVFVSAGGLVILADSMYFTEHWLVSRCSQISLHPYDASL